MALVIALAAMAATASPGGAKGYEAWTEKLAKGVTLTRIKDPKGPYRIKVVTVDLNAAATLDVALASDKLPGFETTSSMARRHGAIAAINGDYARPSGRP